TLFKILICVIPLLVLIGWLCLIRDIDLTGSYAHGQEPAKQIKFALTNPHSFVNVLWNTYFFPWSDAAVRSVIGSFGWADTPLALSWVIIGFMAYSLIATVKPEKDRKESGGGLNIKQRLYILTLGVLFCLLV